MRGHTTGRQQQHSPVDRQTFAAITCRLLLLLRLMAYCLSVCLSDWLSGRFVCRCCRYLESKWRDQERALAMIDGDAELAGLRHLRASYLDVEVFFLGGG